MPLSTHSSLVIDPNDALLQFDTIFAIDSNTRQINGCPVSVAAITLGKWATRGMHPTIRFASTQAMEFRCVDCHPDLLALKCFFENFKSTPGIDAAGKVGVIIDSHLGNLTKIESRLIPILDECYLPSWATIVYASDAASDRLPNVLLRNSDKAANDLLCQIEGADWSEESPFPFSDHATYFRVWNAGKAG
ncbi:MAG: hypothetical protein WAV07_06065 [Candidatus Contendobacter sp.]